MGNTRQWRNQREQSRQSPPPLRRGSCKNFFILGHRLCCIADRLCSTEQIVRLTKKFPTLKMAKIWKNWLSVKFACTFTYQIRASWWCHAVDLLLCHFVSNWADGSRGKTLGMSPVRGEKSPVHVVFVGGGQIFSIHW